MKKHTKLYLKHFNYGTEDFIPCELTGLRAIDIHHIIARGMGGTSDTEDIDNLMALTREAHSILGDVTEFIPTLKEAHIYFMDYEVPYIQVDPHNPIFDRLLINYKTLIQQWRTKLH